MALEGFWNKDRVNILTANWTTQTASEIALWLETTRSAVIGKAHRLKLASKKRPTPPGGKRARWNAVRRRQRRAQQQNAPMAISVRPEPIPPPQPVKGGVHIMDLRDHHCRAVVGSGPDGLARYCGAQKEGFIRTRSGGMVSSYCAPCGNRFYNRPDSA